MADNKAYIGLVEARQGLRISLKTEWSPYAAGDAKQTPGARWDAKTKLWMYPASMSTCRSLRRVYGDRLVIHPDLSDWARNQVELEKETKNLGKVHDADLRIVPQLAPKIDQAMSTRTYQRSGARFLDVVRKGGLLDEPGLGKTITSIGGLIEAGKWVDGAKILVIAPKTAAGSTWPGEIERWAPPANIYMASHGSAAKNNKTIAEALAPQSSPGPTVVIVNFEMLRIKKEDYCKKCDVWMGSGAPKPEHYTANHKTTWEIQESKHKALFDVEWDAIIADECHRYLLKARPASKRIPQATLGAMTLRVTPNGMRVPLTGTPFRGKEMSMFGILHWVEPKVFTSYWNWVDTYLNKTSNGFAVVVGGVKEGMEKEFQDMVSRYLLRRTRSEVRKELPAQNIIDDWVDLEGKHAKQYKEFSEKGVADLESGVFEAIGVLSEITRLKQFAFGTWTESPDKGLIPESKGTHPKLDRLLEVMEEKGIDNSNQQDAPKIIIASQFTRIINFISTELSSRGIDNLLITGEVTGVNRKHAVDTFNSPEGPRVLLMNTKAGGESITLDAYCDEMVILDETFVEDDQVQLRGRIDNRGNEVRPRFYRYIRTRGTIEESIANSNASQWNMQSELLDRNRGAEIAVRIIKGLEDPSV